MATKNSLKKQLAVAERKRERAKKRLAAAEFSKSTARQIFNSADSEVERLRAEIEEIESGEKP